MQGTAKLKRGIAAALRSKLLDKRFSRVRRLRFITLSQLHAVARDCYERDLEGNSIFKFLEHTREYTDNLH